MWTGTFSAIFGIVRARFLVLTPVCVALGAAVARWSKGGVDINLSLVVLTGALCAHMAVNALNEYADFNSGLDLNTVRTPFSGGSGVLPANPRLAPLALILGVFSLSGTVLAGSYLLFKVGPALLLYGVPGLVIIVSYTRVLNRYPLLCLLAPGTGFGLLMVMGSGYTLMQEYSIGLLLVSLMVFFLVNGLLLLNQFPDIEADRAVGRRHYPVMLGRRVSARIYVIFLLLAYVALAAGIMWHKLPAWCLLGMLSLLLAVPLVYGVLRHAERVDRLLPCLGLNVVQVMVMPVLVALGLYIA
jgi:1,4-dihydroxy-2-naphthoate octaprenyltransferase